MSFLYDLVPGVLVETEKPLDADELEQARAAYDEKPTVAQHKKLAAALGGTVHEPNTRPVVRVGVDQAELKQLLERAYPNEAERARIEEQLRG